MSAVEPSDAKAPVRHGYDAVSERYRRDDEQPAAYLEWLRDLQGRLAPGSAVLDLGCECGVPVAQALARVVGGRPVPVQVERAQRLVPAARFRCEDMTASPFRPASFELDRVPVAGARRARGDAAAGAARGAWTPRRPGSPGWGRHRR
ncbi:MAG: class I SAM-dependent methyltransferase [Egibacteraceae bacterium]